MVDSAGIRNGSSSHARAWRGNPSRAAAPGALVVGASPQALVEQRDEALEALVDVEGDAEAAGRLERHEAVQRRADGACRVDGVVALEPVAREDGPYHRH